MNKTLICSLLMGCVLLPGCTGGDRYQQVAEVATQAADRQAQQNTEMARVNREAAEGTRRMIEADSQARKEIVAVHHELQAERATLNEGFDSLESERKQIAQERRTESILVPAAKLLGGACLAIALLVFCTALLHGRRHDDAIEAELNDLLIQDLICDQPQLVSLRDTTPRIEAQSPSEDNETSRLMADE